MYFIHLMMTVSEQFSQTASARSDRWFSLKSTCSYAHLDFRIFKGIVHPKMKMLSLITHPHVIPNLQALYSSSEHTLRYSWWNPRALWWSIDSKGTTTEKSQKRSKAICKTVHVTSVVLRRVSQTYACGAADVTHALFTCRGKHVYASWYSP